MEQENKQPQTVGFVIPREYLLKGIAEAVKEKQKMLERAREKYKERYNWKNDFEECIRRFGFKDHEKLLKEYELIWQKMSNQPSIIRSVIRQIGDRARELAINKYIRDSSKTPDLPQMKEKKSDRHNTLRNGK